MRHAADRQTCATTRLLGCVAYRGEIVRFRGARALTKSRRLDSAGVAADRAHHGNAPRSREIVRAPSRTYEISSLRGWEPSQIRSIGPEMEMAPTAIPRLS